VGASEKLRRVRPSAIFASDLTGVLDRTSDGTSCVEVISSALIPQGKVQYFLPCARKATLPRNVSKLGRQLSKMLTIYRCYGPLRFFHC
jgi:hypothetical protein